MRGRRRLVGTRELDGKPGNSQARARPTPIAERSSDTRVRPGDRCGASPRLRGGIELVYFFRQPL